MAAQDRWDERGFEAKERGRRLKACRSSGSAIAAETFVNNAGS